MKLHVLKVVSLTHEYPVMFTTRVIGGSNSRVALRPSVSLRRERNPSPIVPDPYSGELPKDSVPGIEVF